MELGGCSHDKIFFVGPDKHPRTHGQFVNARYARFTNSNPSSGFASARIGVFWSHSVRSKNRPFVLACLSGPTNINILGFDPSIERYIVRFSSRCTLLTKLLFNFWQQHQKCNVLESLRLTLISATPSLRCIDHQASL